MKSHWWLASACGLCLAAGCTNFNQMSGPQINIDRIQYRITPWWVVNRPLFNTPASQKTAAFLNSLNPNFIFLGPPCPYGFDYPPGTFQPSGVVPAGGPPGEFAPSVPADPANSGVTVPVPAASAQSQEPLPTLAVPTTPPATESDPVATPVPPVERPAEPPAEPAEALPPRPNG
jgi:hypothetical protein